MITNRTLPSVQIRRIFIVLILVVIGWNVSIYYRIDDVISLSFSSSASSTTMQNITFMLPIICHHGKNESIDGPNNNNNNDDDNSISSPLLWESTLLTLSSPSTYVINDDNCHTAIQYFRQINECRGDCAVVHNISKPVFHWSFLTRQGFGRVIDNSIYQCAMAISLGRPCLVDISSRDPFFTLRSFISMPLDVDIAAEAQHGRTSQLSLLTKEQAMELQDVVLLLKHPGDADYKDEIKERQYNHILPLPKLSEEEEEQSKKNKRFTTLDEIRQQYNRIVVSPNWGPPSFWDKSLVWPSVPPSTVQYTNHPSSCSRTDPRLITMIQNYMYRPTKLAIGLHRAYRNHVLGGKDNNDEDDKNKSNNNSIPYGAIHIRFHILRTSNQFPKKEQSLDQIQEATYSLAKRSWKRITKLPKFMSVWWLVSDDMNYGKNVTEYLNEFSLNELNGTIRFVTDNGDRTPDNKTNVDGMLGRILGHRFSSSKPRHVLGSKEGTIHHSIDPDAIGPGGHEFMATSILDWMVLHESDMAIVTAGSFGASGARGRNKALFLESEKSKYDVLQCYIPIGTYSVGPK